MATKRQASLVEWCGRKKGRESSETESDVPSPRLEDISANGEPSSSSTTTSVPSCSRPETDGEESDADAEISVSNCTTMCCASGDKAYQPTNKQIISLFASKGRNFQPQCYKQFTRLTVCTSSKKVYCLYCRYAVQHNMIKFIKTGEKAFTQNGFQKWRKAIEKFKAHETSHTHKEAMMKWSARYKPTIAAELSSQLLKLQQLRREGLLMQLRAILFLTRQGIAIRGHTESEGNLYQLLKMWSINSDAIKNWLSENRYTSHQFVNEVIDIMGLSVLRSVLKRMKECSGPAWFSIIADEATDINQAEQLNLSIRWVDDEYQAHEDLVGLFRVPDTKAETLFKVIKDLLIWCDLPLALCRGQAYDGASNMQGRRTGVATRVCREQPAAVPVHCCCTFIKLMPSRCRTETYLYQRCLRSMS